MNKIVTKKTARLLSVVLAVLVMVNVLPFGADKPLQAQADAENGGETAKIPYTIELVDAEDNALPISGVNVSMELVGGKDKNDNDNSENSEKSKEETYFETAATDNGTLTFQNVIAERQYKVTLSTNENTDKSCTIPADWDNSSEEHTAKTEFTVYVENIDGEENKILVPVDDDWLNLVDYTVKVKNNTDLKEYIVTSNDGEEINNYKMNLGYWSVDNSNNVTSVDKFEVSDDFLSFKISGLLGKTYGIQVSGVPFVSVGRSDIKLMGQTERENSEPDLVLESKRFTVKFDKQSFENGYVYEITGDDEISQNFKNAEFSEDDALDLDEYEKEFSFGDSPKYVIDAKDGYRIESYKLNGEKTDSFEETNQESNAEKNSRCIVSIDGIKQPTTVSAVIVKKTYEVSFTVSDNGSVTLESNSEELNNIGGLVTVKTGDSKNVDETAKVTVSAISQEGYHIGKFRYEESDTDKKSDNDKDTDLASDVLKENKGSEDYGQNEPKKSEKTIENIHSNYRFDVEFVIDEFFVEAEESDKGTVSFEENKDKTSDGRAKVKIGDSLNVNVTPKKGYHLDYVQIFKKNAEDENYSDTPETTLYLLDSENIKDNSKNNGEGIYSFNIPDIRSNVKIKAVYAENVTVSMNQIKITNPYKKEYSEKTDDKYVRYTYRNDALNNISVSYQIEAEEGEKTGLRGTAKTKDGDITFGGFDVEEYSISQSDSYVRVTSVEIYYERQWHKVDLKDGDIIFILDTTAPANSGYLSKKPSEQWTNEPSVTVSGRIDTKNESIYTSTLDCVVWSKDVSLSDTEIRNVQLGRHSTPGYEFGVVRPDDKESGTFDTAKGGFSFVISGEQESNYYVYAVDYAGNILHFKSAEKKTPIVVGIDNTKPIINEFKIHDTDSSGNAVTFDEFGAAASGTVKVDVTAWDFNSGILSITLYGYDLSGQNKQTFTQTSKNTDDDLINYTATFEIDGKQYVSLAAVAEDRAGNKIEVPVPMDKDNSNSYTGSVITGSEKIETNINGDSSKIKYFEKHDDETVSEWYSSTDFNVEYSAADKWAGFSSIEMNLITYDKNDQSKAVKTTPIKYLSENNALDSVFTYDYKNTDNMLLFNSGNVHQNRTTQIKNTVNIKTICDVKENNINFGEEIKDGRNTIQIIVYSREHTGKTQYVSETFEYDFYLDTKKPTIHNIKFSPKKQNAAEVVINVLTFGLFANGNLQVDVEIDDSEVYSSSGYKNVDLIYNGSVIQTKVPDAINRDSGSAGTVQTISFVIPEKDITFEDRHINGTITAQVYDNTENASGQFTPKSSDTDPTRTGEISYVMIENVNPEISNIKFKEQYGDRNGNTYNGNIWYNEDVSFGIEVVDSDSGVGKVQAEINGTVINGSDGSEYLYNSDKPNVLRLENQFVENGLVKTNASGVEMNGDGSYKLTVNAVDNAGNKADSKQITVYKDTSVPTITQFEFIGDGSRNGDGVPNDNIEMTEYGYYFKEDTQIRIHTNDEYPSSGVNNIYFKAVPAVESGSSMVDEQAKAESDGTYVFTVPANFKGQIFARADDNVGNHTDKFVTPSGTIIETPEEHNNEQHIFIRRLTQEPSHTSSGSPLYAGPVDVEFTIVDTYSGIEDAEVTINNHTYSVKVDNGKPESDTIDNWSIEGRDYNLVTVLRQVITVTDNMNDIPITVKMTDRSGNTSTAESSFSIDTTAPQIKIEFDKTKSEEGISGFYNRSKTATIIVTERNFAQKNIQPNITNTDGTTPAISGWTSSGSGDGATHTATVTFASDGDYTFSAYCFDDVGNRSNTASIEDFTIDLTSPNVSITYDNNDSKNGSYYAKERTATIEINEHNFDASRVDIKLTANDNGEEPEPPKPSNWTDNGNRHTATVKFSEDALYTLSVSVTDKAGNKGNSGGEDRFYVDQTKPSIEFSGVKNKSANKDEIAPVIKMTDKNFNKSGAKITLSGSNNGEVTSYVHEASDIYSDKLTNLLIGQVDAYDDFAHTSEVDDLYTLSVDVTDKAGNKSTEILEFSANRKGSVYTMVGSYDDYFGNYHKEPIDIVIKETNVDDIRNVNMTVAVNGNSKEISDSEYTVQTEGGNGEWTQNTYTIKSDVFEKSAKYEVRASSVDRATNENQSDISRIDASKELNIDFVIDSESPEIEPVNFSFDDKKYLNEFEAAVLIRDSNIVAESCEVTIDGKKAELTQDPESLDIYHFTVSQNTSKQNIVISALDMAGNTGKAEFNLTVTTNKFVIWFSSTPRVIATIIGGLLLAGIIIFIVAAARRKRAAR